MKLKGDFTTNSSSASFILYVEALTNKLDEFIRDCWDPYIKYYISSYSYRLIPKAQEYRKFLEEEYKERIEVEKKIKDETIDKKELGFFNLTNHVLVDPQKLSDDDIIKEYILESIFVGKKVGNVFSVSYWTSMFNNLTEDVPPWMIELILMYNMNPNDLTKFGMKSVKLEVSED